MTMISGERQVAPSLDGIRRDHRARYEFAARALKRGSRVIDVACGVGYGSSIMAHAGHEVRGFDRDREALAYGRKHYPHAKVELARIDAAKPPKFALADAAVCFETIEHVEDPRPLLRALRAAAPRLLVSAPNEAEFTFIGQPFHFRHYTAAQLEQLLLETGWKVIAWLGQEDDEAEVAPGAAGRTIIAEAERCAPRAPAKRRTIVRKGKPPRHVSIVGLGPTSVHYLAQVRGLGGRHAYCDETWTINALGDVFASDLIFHMDDVRVQEVRAAAAPQSNIANMLAWVKDHPGPIVTSVAHDGYPGLVEFPLEDVVNRFPKGYFNSTAAYAVAYAVHIGVQKLSLWGMDFTYPDAHDAEKGRACVEYWLGIAVERGIEIAVPKQSSLLDALYPRDKRFYGYDCVELDIRRRDGRVRIELTEHGRLPTAEAIEAAYDHGKHPNPLLNGGT